VKLHSHLMREAFAGRDWPAAADLLIDYFNITGCRRFSPYLDVVHSAQLRSSILLWDKAFRYEWCASYGFVMESYPYHSVVFLIRDGKL